VLRLAIAQMRPRKGAYEENLARLGALFREVAGSAEPPELLVAPEAALTGYFLEGGVRDLAVGADRLFHDLSCQHQDANAPPLDVALGFYEVHQNRLFNSGLYATLGGPDAGIRHVHRKVFLPTYGVFDEERFVEAGRGVQAFDTRWGRAAILICEDAWHSFTPMLAALGGGPLILIPSASPARGVEPAEEAPGRPASLARWNRLVQDIAGEHGVYVALAQLVGFEGGKAFPGGSLVASPRGELLAEGPIFEEAFLQVTLDFEEITRARADMPLLSDLEMRLPHLLGSLHEARRAGKGSGAPGAAGSGEKPGMGAMRGAGMAGMAGVASAVRPGVTLSGAKGAMPGALPLRSAQADSRGAQGERGTAHAEPRATQADPGAAQVDPGAAQIDQGAAQNEPGSHQGALEVPGRNSPVGPCGVAPIPYVALAPGSMRADPSRDPLAIDAGLTRRWLVEFIRDEVQRRRGFERVVIGLSGGVDSSVVAYLAAEALGPRNVVAVRMPYRTSSPESLAHAQLVVDALGMEAITVDISAAVDGLAAAMHEQPDAARLGNIMARTRMITLFDISAARRALPLGTGNKTERLFGYFTWHADDSPPVNPIGDLFKSQVWALARHLGLPDVIVSKPASADLIKGQTDEGDFGISYPRADAILHWILLGYRSPEIAALGFSEEEIALVRRRLDSTHWKRRLPTVAMLSATAIGEYYLRPVDF
jgi:NAD+ synthetase